MPNPWEKYQDTSTAQGPWAKYSAPPPGVPDQQDVQASGFLGKTGPSYQEWLKMPGNKGKSQFDYLNRHMFQQAQDAFQYQTTEKSLNAIHDIGQGNYAKGAHEAITGPVATMATPFLPEAVTAAPVATAVSMGTGLAGGAASKGIAKSMGATPDQANLAGDIGGIATGAIGAGLTSSPARRFAGKMLSNLTESVDPELVGVFSPRLAHAMRIASKLGKAMTPEEAEVLAAGAKSDTVPAVGDFPKTEIPPAPYRLKGSQLTEPATATPKQIIPPSRQLPENAGQVPAIGNFPKTDIPEAPASPRAELMPSERAPSGESALRMVLTGQDNANLMRIAKSRGINVTREAQLKPGVADKMLIDKIMSDFSPEELDNISAQYMEANRFKHEFGDIGPEAWKALSMKTYFPDVKLPMTMLKRTTGAIAKAGESQATPVTTTAYRYGEPSGDVSFYSKQRDYAEEYATTKGGSPSDVKEHSVSLRNPMRVNATDKQMADPAFEQSHIAQAKKAGNDGVIFSNGQDEFYAAFNQPKYAYRVRDVGDKGIMPKGHAQATLDPEQAQGYVSGRGQAQNSAQEVVRVDLNKLSPKDYVLKKGPGGKTWVQFKQPVPESFIEGATPQVPNGNEAELLQKSIDLLNRLHPR